MHGGVMGRLPQVWGVDASASAARGEEIKKAEGARTLHPSFKTHKVEQPNLGGDSKGGSLFSNCVVDRAGEGRQTDSSSMDCSTKKGGGRGGKKRKEKTEKILNSLRYFLGKDVVKKASHRGKVGPRRAYVHVNGRKYGRTFLKGEPSFP